MNNFVKRMLSAIVMIFFLALALIAKIEVFNVLIGILAFLAAFEWQNIDTKGNVFINSLAAITASILYAFFLYNDFEWLVYIAVVFWLGTFFQIGHFVKKPKPNVRCNKYTHSLQGLLITVSTCYALATLREFGMEFVIALFVWVGAMDVGGYLVGKKFGSHKLLPDVSPGKTIEGMLGGLFLVLASTAIMFYIMELDSYSLLEYSIVGLIIALFAVMGDLFESMIKRRYGVKDTGNIIPGHGGVLDRIDSLTAAAPALAALIFFMPS